MHRDDPLIKHDSAASLSALQAAVQHKLGGCMLRLQQYERLLKAVMAHSALEGEPAQIEVAFKARLDRLRKVTLGGLLSLLTSSYLRSVDDVCDDAEPALAPEGVPIYMRWDQSWKLTAEDLETTKAELSELLELRNDLVHHFLDRFDLTLAEQCEAAVSYLENAKRITDRHYEKLQFWAKPAEPAAAEQIAAIHDNLVRFGIGPDGQVLWPISGIVAGLRGAEQALRGATGKQWVRLDDAIAWMREHRPSHTPEYYGCTSWSEVLLACRQFETRGLREDGAQARRAVSYRTRPGWQEREHRWAWHAVPKDDAE